LPSRTRFGPPKHEAGAIVRVDDGTAAPCAQTHPAVRDPAHLLAAPRRVSWRSRWPSRSSWSKNGSGRRGGCGHRRRRAVTEGGGFAVALPRSPETGPLVVVVVASTSLMVRNKRQEEAAQVDANDP